MTVTLGGIELDVEAQDVEWFDPGTFEAPDTPEYRSGATLPKEGEFPVASHGRTVGNSAADFAAYRGLVSRDDARLAGALLGDDVTFDDGVSDPADVYVGGMGWGPLPEPSMVTLHFELWNVPGSPATLVQAKYATSQSEITPSFDSTITQGNVMLTVSFNGNASDTYSTDPRDGGTCPPDSHMTDLIRGIGTSTSPEDCLSFQGKVIGSDTYSGPFGQSANCNTPAYHALELLEFSGVQLSGFETLSQEGGTSTSIDLGDFTVGSNDLVLMAIVWKAPASDPGISVNGFTELLDQQPFDLGNSWAWLGYKVGDGDASVTASSVPNNWGAAAIKLQGS